MDWQAVRDLVELNPNIIYLNSGTSSAVPKTVHQAAMIHREQLHQSPTDYVWRSSAEELWKSRTRVAKHVGTTPDRIIFFQNISQAINTFCLSVDIPAGSEILLTDHEYLPMRWAWERAARKKGWTLSTFSLPIHSNDPAEITHAFVKAMTAKTRLLFFSHILYTMGMILPAEAICAEARNRGVLTFIDGAHAPGMIPLKLDTFGVDFYSTNLHKWFMSEVGAAFLYVKSGLEHHLEPWQVSWGYHYSRKEPHQPNEFGSTPWIRQFEMEGTRDYTAWLLLHHNCDFLDQIGAERIRQRQNELSDVVRAKLNGLCGLKLITPGKPDLRGGLTAFILPPEIESQLARKVLWDDHRIEINMVDHPQGPFLRVSTHVYNMEPEVEALAHVLPSVFAKARK